ncbi:MAG: hypothetical protein AAFQ44_07315 [Pseudomonadota bacterium]
MAVPMLEKRNQRFMGCRQWVSGFHATGINEKCINVLPMADTSRFTIGVETKSPKNSGQIELKSLIGAFPDDDKTLPR